MAEEQSTAAGTHVPVEHQEATALGLNAGGWVAIAMLVVFAVMIWKKVPAAITRALDGRIAAIRSQLDEATALRKEAEALRAEYEKKAKAADQEAAAMIERRTRMAEDKIAAEERAAIDGLRSAAATAATRAAETLIVEHHGPDADAKLVSQTIAELPSR
ncbi:MAG: hypothetical protein ABIN68_02620 [Sphingomicrobium sp.]